ncbi:hypothetical protein BDFG_00871 [Blastomyces dermatitidis ATCC 26199]|nr:hypothetical protein BDFG_00871 [Blastomyces dermatitidis ATCC 26199]
MVRASEKCCVGTYSVGRQVGNILEECLLGYYLLAYLPTPYRATEYVCTVHTDYPFSNINNSSVRINRRYMAAKLKV